MRCLLGTTCVRILIHRSSPSSYGFNVTTYTDEPATSCSAQAYQFDTIAALPRTDCADALTSFAYTPESDGSATLDVWRNMPDVGDSAYAHATYSIPADQLPIVNQEPNPNQ